MNMRYLITVSVVAMIYVAQGTSLVAAKGLMLGAVSTVSSESFQKNFFNIAGKNSQVSSDLTPVAYSSKKSSKKSKQKIGRPKLSTRVPMIF
ncbi:hypothetical protein V3565_02615 [Bartonella sp. B10]